MERPSLTLTHHIAASPKQVFEAWVDPEKLKQWWGPGANDRTDVADLDLRDGGRYHVVTHAQNGDTYDFNGTYRALIPGQTLSFTWEAGPQPSRVTVTFKGGDSDTELTLVHDELSSKEERDNCLKGWKGALEKLERSCTGKGSDATAQVSRTIDAPPAEIWKALTTPRLLKSYFLGADVESDWKLGSAIRFRGDFKGKPYEDKGEIKALEPNKRLAFSHFSPLAGKPDAPENYHLVAFDLAPAQDATRVTLTQSNLTGGVKESDIKMRAEFEKNWTTVLDGLKKTVEKR